MEIPQASRRFRTKIESDVPAAIAKMGAGIESIGIANRDGVDSAPNFVIGGRDRTHLARIMRRIRGIGEVSRITSMGHRRPALRRDEA